jgi:hypothetical protein
VTNIKNEIVHIIDNETDNWVYGSTYTGNTFFCNWVKYKGYGNPPSPEQLKETERKRIEIAEAYRAANPREPSKEYYEAIKKWPLKGK